MDALTARTPLDLTDYAAAALPSTPADSVVAIGLKGSRLGPVMRLDDVAAPATMAGVIAASMRRANCTRVFLIGYGPEDRALRWFEVDLVQDDGTVVARVRKQVYVRRKPARS